MFLLNKFFISKKRYDRECAERFMAIDQSVMLRKDNKDLKDRLDLANNEYREMKSSSTALQNTIKNLLNRIDKLQRDDKETGNAYQKHSDRQNEEIFKLKKKCKYYKIKSKRLEKEYHRRINLYRILNDKYEELLKDNGNLLKDITKDKWIDKWIYKWVDKIFIIVILINIISIVLNIIL